MANHPSAEKRNRQTQRRTAVNSARKSRIRSFVKKVETAIAGRTYAGVGAGIGYLIAGRKP